MISNVTQFFKFARQLIYLLAVLSLIFAEPAFAVDPPGFSWTVTPSAGAGGTINPSTPVTVNNGSTTTFTVTPNNGYVASVGGTCGGNLNGTTFTTNAITANCTVSATFTTSPPPPPPPGTFTLTVTPPSNGTVTGPGITCPGDCSETYSSGTGVSLTATPASDYSFGGWGGDCAFAGTATTCTLTMTASKAVSVTFNPPPPPPGTFSLTVALNGSVDGIVTSNQGGINCGGVNTGICTTTLTNGASVTLTATPTSPTTFGGWGGDCAFAGTATTCTLTMTASKAVSVTFNPPPPPPGTFSLTVTPPSNGSVTGSGISCPGDCSEPYSSGASVSLTANPNPGYSFGGWGGDCAGQGNPCPLTMTAAKSVTATFTASGGGGGGQITNTTGAFNSSPSINADGTRIAFGSNSNLTGDNPGGSMKTFLWTQDSGFTQITSPTWGYDGPPSINADGTRIAFDSNSNLTGDNLDHNSEIFLWTQGTGLTQLTNTKASNICDYL